MNSTSGADSLAGMSRDEMHAALFANMVVQQANMAMMLMGKVAHPETGQFMQDFETARMFIDQLEMLAAKTKGNLSKQEEGLLKQALSTVQMSFVEAVEAPPEATGAPKSMEAPEPAKPETAAPKPEESKAAPADAPANPANDESRKKFSKKY